MVLSDLRTYLRQQHTVALNDLVNHFNMEAEAIRGMLGKWISKGKVKKLTPNSSCGTSCCKCDPTLTELYQWVEK